MGGLLWVESLISILPNEVTAVLNAIPDSKVHGANMGPIWGRQDPGGPHVGPENFAIWDIIIMIIISYSWYWTMLGYTTQL